MDKVHKLSDSECYAQSLEPFIIYFPSRVYFQANNEIKSVITYIFGLKKPRLKAVGMRSLTRRHTSTSKSWH
jgi:hypothetical protein